MKWSAILAFGCGMYWLGSVVAIRRMERLVRETQEIARDSLALSVDSTQSVRGYLGLIPRKWPVPLKKVGVQEGNWHPPRVYLQYDSLDLSGLDDGLR